MAIQSYSWCYDTANIKIFHFSICCKDFLFTEVENPVFDMQYFDVLLC